MPKSPKSNSSSRSGAENFHHPNYKGAKLGYTRIPTTIAENHEKWGLTKNGLAVYLFLLARVKKDTWFNGEKLKIWMPLGREAISNGLKNLVSAGFCKRRRHRDEIGQICGWSYSFFAIPVDESLVSSIDPDIAEKLRTINWFAEKPEPGNPEPENPCSGFAQFKGMNERKEGNEKRKTPPPLPREEGDFDFPSREKGEESTDAEKSDGPCGIVPDVTATSNSSFDRQPGDTPQPGTVQRWREKMLNCPEGRQFLEMLRPGQIPADKALRSVCNIILKGKLPSAYIAFLEEVVVRKNHAAADQNGVPLKSIAEILSFMSKEECGVGGSVFGSWKDCKVVRLSSEWRRLHRKDDDWSDLSDRRHAISSCGYPLEIVMHEPGPGDPPVVPPTSLFAHLELHKQGAAPDPGPVIIAELKKPAVWKFLVREATLNYAELTCFFHIVHAYKDALPLTCLTDLAELHACWPSRRAALREQIEKGFTRIGAKPPQVSPPGESQS